MTGTLVHAFITTIPDYSDGLMYGLPCETISQVQWVQNSAARLMMRTRRFEHSSPVPWQLHWLPVPQRNILKYLDTDLSYAAWPVTKLSHESIEALYVNAHTLRSAKGNLLTVLPSRLIWQKVCSCDANIMEQSSIKQSTCWLCECFQEDA